MGRTEVIINELSVSAVNTPVLDGLIAVVFDASRGRANKVYQISSVSDLTKIYGNTEDEGIIYSKYLLQQGATLLTVRAEPVTGSAKASVVIPTDKGTFTVQSVGAGVGGNTLKVLVEVGLAGFDLRVFDTIGDKVVEIEAFKGLSLESDSRNYFLTKVKSEVIEIILSGEEAPTTITAGTYDLEGGLGKESNDTNFINALNALDTLDIVDGVGFNFLITPGITNEDTEIINTVKSILESRGNCLGFIDVPDNTPVSSIINIRKDFDSSSLSMYYPSMYVLVDNKKYLVPGSVLAADKNSYFFRTGKPWVPPAGFDEGILENVVDYSVVLSKQDRIALQSASVNPIIVRPGVGAIIYGHDTLQKSNNAFSRVEVRNVINYIKTKIARISEKYSFKSNTVYTWNQWKNEVEPVLRKLKVDGGIENYYLDMSEKTISAQDKLNGIARGVITIDPVNVIDTVILNLLIDDEGISFE